jgi:phosphoglycolate phosphatase
MIDRDTASAFARLPRPKAVLYDWDNTLADNWGAIVAAMNHTLAAFDVPTWDEVEARRRIKASLRDAFPKLFGERWQDAREVYYAHFSAHHLDHLKPMPGAVDLLDAMAERGVYQAVVSNKTGKYLRAEAEALGWSDRFGKLIGANDAVRDKPDIAPVLSALESTDILPSQEVWFVGDSDIDMQCAHNGGMTGILIPPPGEDATEKRSEAVLFPPAVTFSSCEAFSVLVSRSFAPI